MTTPFQKREIAKTMSESENYATLRGLLQNIANDTAKALNLPPETGDAAALRTENALLRGLLRGVYHAAELLNNKQLNPMYDRQPTADEANAINATVQVIRHATGNYAEQTQVIIGETTNIPIPDIFGDVIGVGLQRNQ